MPADLALSLPGTRFPPGRSRIEPWQDVLLRDLLDAPPRNGDSAHPVWGYIAAQGGIGIDVDGILELAQARAEDGPMLASTRIEIPGELRVGVEYDVSGEVLAIERKQGRTLGSFDLYTFRIEFREAEANAVATSLTATWMLPRRGTG